MKLFKNQFGFNDTILVVIVGGIIGALFITGVFIWKEVEIYNSIGSLGTVKVKEDDDAYYDASEVSIEDWLTYTHPVLGLEFKYKEEWGEPVTSPSKYITNLDNLLTEISPNNSYYNRVGINFPDSDISISIFNNEHKGELYPNANAYPYGPIDNFFTLKETEDICDYKVNFINNPSNTGIIVEDYSECSNDVKTALLKDTKASINRYQYNLRHYGFKKLKNDSIDNLLVTFLVGYTSQLKDDNVSFDNFLDYELVRKEKISQEQYLQDKEDFIVFVKNIKTFEPEKKQLQLIEINDKDSIEIATIKKYYNNIMSGNLSDAYQMYIDPEVDNIQYEQWYQNTILAKPRDFENTNGNTYRFYVDFQDDNKEPQIYRVTMEVIDEKINLLSSEEITSQDVVFEDMKAFTKTLRDYNYVILYDGENEVDVDRAPDYVEGRGPGEALSFSSLEFSPDGRYLKYKAQGWEWSILRVYDIEKKKQVLGIGGFGMQGFSPDGDYFYACFTGGMSGSRYINIYSLPDFDLINTGEDLGILDDEFYGSPECNLNSEDNTLDITISGYLSWPDDYIEYFYNYDFETGKLIDKN
ncbi:hypothetical protein C0580_04990 [Candidatus Parcubacteria bacterium]|nr:MAG: hypothetical protein C0580_04990 [Candidatus Parcubacteria bacterium]